MNYLKQLWQQFHLTDECSSQQEEQRKNQNKTKEQNNTNSAQQSGQFQVIEFEDFNQIQEANGCKGYSQNKPQNYLQQKKLSTGNQVQHILNINIKQKNCPTLSQQQLVIKKKLANQYMIIQLDPLKQSQKLPIPQKQVLQQPKQSRSASTIQMDEYYMIVDSQQLTKTFQSQEQWTQFYQKIKEFNNKQAKLNGYKNISYKEEELMGCQRLSSVGKNHENYTNHGKKQRISLTLKQLNSILQIQPQDLHRRQQYWSAIAFPSIPVNFKSSQLANKKDPKYLQRNVDKIMQTLVPSLLYEIAQKRYKPIQNIEDQLQKWQKCIVKVLTMYGANDKQIGYSKGLQYLAIGLMVSIVVRSQTQQKIQKIENLTNSQQNYQLFYHRIETHFKYLMFTKNLRNMYFTGTPKLYPEIQSLTELMRLQTPLIYQMLQEMKVQFIKLFINYYKTFLLYKIKNPQVIRKIMELLIIYGLDLVRIVIIRILSRQEKKILQMRSDEDAVLKYIAQHLVSDYFGMAQGKQVIIKSKNLFVLQNGI